jgi:lactoylglutathione lyase
MAFHDAFTILYSADVTRLSSFYAERLGFDRGYRWPDEGEPAFLVVTLGSFAIGLSKSDPAEPAGRVAFWLYTDNVDQEFERLRRQGVVIVAEPADTEWGERMATISDPDGNHVHIGQRAENRATS